MSKKSSSKSKISITFLFFLFLVLIIIIKPSSALVAGDCCSANGGLGCSDTTCQDMVCAVDPFCCTGIWDNVCAQEAVTMCGICAGTTCVDGQARYCTLQAGVCAGSAEVCTNTSWLGCNTSIYSAFSPDYQNTETNCADGLDNDCNGLTDLLDSSCNIVTSGSCCSANMGVGCSDQTCQNTVCAVDSFCCTNIWDNVCAQEALTMCNICTGISCVDGQAQSCTLQAGVCAGSSEICTNTSWLGCTTATYSTFSPDYQIIESNCTDGIDNDCNGLADSQDSSCPGTPTGNCCSANGGFGCNNATCQQMICDIAPACCNQGWDATCASLAGQYCGVCGGSSCTNGQTQACTQQLGACAGSVSNCFFYGFPTCDDTTYLFNNPNYQPLETICNDNMDNDCNGLTDMQEPQCRGICIDLDGDGFAIDGGVCGQIDCNDGDALINPGMIEICNNLIDDDCNGLIDNFDFICSLGCTDLDGDGFSIEGGACGLVDCNDNDLFINPNGIDICDNIDNDCNALTLDGSGVALPLNNNQFGVCLNSLQQCINGGYQEVYNNIPGYESIELNCADGLDNDCNTLTDSQEPQCQILICTDADNDGYAIEGGACSFGLIDCNDANALINPGASDVNCNGVDDNCNIQVDEGFIMSPTTCGVGACAAMGMTMCTNGVLTDSCIAGTPTTELCTNLIDDDCNGLTDSADPTCQILICTDADNDGYAIEGGACSFGLIDCNDANALINPGASDVNCNGVDDNCNIQVDEGFISTPTSCGVGVCSSTGANTCINGMVMDSCTPGLPVAETCNNLDDNCNNLIDDGIASLLTSCGIGSCASTGNSVCINGVMSDNCVPSLPTQEICDGQDNDCNGLIDDGVQTTFYQDSDLDGFGNALFSQLACSSPPGFVSNNLDCNDANALINPGASDANCNGVDDNCNGIIDEGCGIRVISSTPLNGTINISINSTIKITFSKTLMKSTINNNNFQLKDQSNKIVYTTLVTKDNTTTIIPSYKLKTNATYTVTITGVKDIAGNLMQSNYILTFKTVIVPNVLPIVTATTPANNSQSVPTNSTIKITFNKPLMKSTINDQSFQIREPNKKLVYLTITTKDNTTTLTPQIKLKNNTVYLVKVANTIKDSSGNPLQSDYIFNFKTA